MPKIIIVQMNIAIQLFRVSWYGDATALPWYNSARLSPETTISLNYIFIKEKQQNVLNKPNK